MGCIRGITSGITTSTTHVGSIHHVYTPCIHITSTKDTGYKGDGVYTGVHTMYSPPLTTNTPSIHTIYGEYQHHY